MILCLPLPLFLSIKLPEGPLKEEEWLGQGMINAYYLTFYFQMQVILHVNLATCFFNYYLRHLSIIIYVESYLILFSCCIVFHSMDVYNFIYLTNIL